MESSFKAEFRNLKILELTTSEQAEKIGFYCNDLKIAIALRNIALIKMFIKQKLQGLFRDFQNGKAL